jgi:hypothetical protein
MRYVSSIVPPLTETGEHKVKAVQRIKPVPRQHGREQPVDTEHLPRPAVYLEERRKAQRRITKQSVLMDRRSGLERRRYNSLGHIDLLPSFSTRLNLVKSVFEKESGLEEAIYGRADHWIFEAGRGRYSGQGAVPQAWL